MLSMFSKKPAAEKTSTDKRIEPKVAPVASVASANPPTGGGNVTALKMPVQQRPAAAPAASQRLKIFENVPSSGQYLYHLSSDIRAFTRSETENAVVKCTPVEIQRVARLLAKFRGRYLAQVVDLGSLKRGSITEMDIGDLRRAREMVEEVENGLAALRDAIERGDLPMDGIKPE